MRRTPVTIARMLLTPAALLILGAGAASAADFHLAAEAYDLTLPDATVVRMWGFAACDPAFSNCDPPSSPGPVLRVPDGESAPVTVSIHLRNNLPVPVSLMIPAQKAGLSPVRFTDPQGRQRTRSFAAETAPGATGVYSWTDFRPGTFIYRSGTRPQVQVQMGLQGAIVSNAVAGLAYPGAAFDTEGVLFYSEIDPALHAAVADGTYGTAAYPSTFPYKPKYFLVNGLPFAAGRSPMDAGSTGARVLLRFINGGLSHRAPQILGAYLSWIAEDGNAYPFAKKRYGNYIPAGGTLDALFVPPSAGIYPIYDRMLGLTSNEVTGGGAYAFLSVAAAVPPLLGGIALPEASPVLENPVSGRTAASENDAASAPAPAGRDLIRKAGNWLTGMLLRLVPKPSANDMAVTTSQDRPVTITLIGARTAAAESVRIVSRPSRGAGVVNNGDGTVTYTPARRRLAADAFRYAIVDRAGRVSDPATVRVHFSD